MQALRSAHTGKLNWRTGLQACCRTSYMTLTAFPLSPGSFTANRHSLLPYKRIVSSFLYAIGHAECNDSLLAECVPPVPPAPCAVDARMSMAIDEARVPECYKQAPVCMCAYRTLPNPHCEHSHIQTLWTRIDLSTHKCLTLTPPSN
jgi:hypothetical protein